MILAALMVGSMAYYTIYILASSAGAADIETEIGRASCRERV